MIKGYKFTVVGKMPFPIDMLRHDSCYPRDTVSANNITASISNEEENVVYKVTLTGSSYPTARRWQSFSWDVIDVEPFN